MRKSKITDNFHGPDAAGYAPHIFFSQFAASSMNIHVIMWFKTNSFIEEEALLNELNMTILKRFNEAGLSMAYPTQTMLRLTLQTVVLVSMLFGIV